MHKIGQFVLIAKHGQKNNFCDIFVAQPDPEKEILAGKLFIVLDINSKNNEGIKLAQFLINYVNNTYYNNEKIILREKISSLKPEHIFESVVAKTNIQLDQFLKKEKIKFYLHNINMTIGLIYDNEIYFTGVGKNKIFLIFKNKQEKQDKYRVAEISEKSEEIDKNEYEPGTKKIFANILTGKIPESGFMVFSNEALPEYISKKNLMEIISTLPPGGAVEHIKNTLQKINDYISFVGIIIKNTSLLPEELEKKINADHKITVKTSVEILNATEDRTEKLLSPSGVIKSRWVINMFSKIFNIKKLLSPAVKKERLFISGNMPIIKRGIMTNINKFLNILKLLLFQFFNALFYIFKALTSKDRLWGAIKNRFNKSKKISEYLWILFKNINLKYKILSFVLLVIGIFFFYNLSSKNTTNKIIQENKDLEALLVLIEQKQNQVDASMLYNNDEGAEKIINEVTELLEKFPKNSAEQTNQLDILRKKFNDQQDKIRKISSISLNEKLADFSLLNNAPQTKNFYLDGDKIFVSDPANKIIYTYDIKNKTSRVIDVLDGKLHTLLYPTTDKNGIIHLFNQNNILEINPKNDQISETDINIPDKANITAMANFNEKLYLLDSAESALYKFTKTAKGYAVFNDWLEEKTDLSQAVDISIDGNIYILYKNGHLEKWLKGKKNEFSLKTAEPAITAAQQLIMPPESDFIYISEPEQSKIIVYKTNGEYVMQYRLENAKNFEYFQVDEKKKIFYVLHNNSIYQSTLVNL
jgi:hypothetical protein